MEYLVFLIYVVVVYQIFKEKPQKTNTESIKGREYYKVAGMANIIFGGIGMMAINFLLRNKNIIPELFVIIGLIGCALMFFFGFYCICRMLFSETP